MENYAELLFIDEVHALQEGAGSAKKFQRFYSQRTKVALDESDLAFIADRESFYIASVSSTGWPYVQHRGGPKGFLKALDGNHLGFVDYPGNRQFITMGHSVADGRVALFLMDYERQARLKLLGRLTMCHAEDADPELCELLSMPSQPKAERVATIEVIAADWNCPKYIPQMITRDKVDTFIQLQIQNLTDENALLKAQIEKLQG